ncbi:response regulator [Zavarzinia sp. CC-PAN008]|uniref:response regulator n=1 Tax=Zavarzinia sp. CC-PAN008 TaxID=3243332 RepID=UPI003F7451E2
MRITNPLPLDDLHILVCEDEGIAAIALDDQLAALGCGSVDVVRDVPGALAMVTSMHFDLALLDVGLGGDVVWPVAELLDRNRIPFVFATGRDPRDLPERWRTYPLLAKPFWAEQLRRAIDRALAPT